MPSKRLFLQSALASGALAFGADVVAAPTTGGAAPTSPVVLTVSGQVGRPNRCPLTPALDQLMAKFQLKFDRARSFDLAALHRLPARQIRPTVEYDAQPHRLRGPLLSDVLGAAGAPTAPDTALLLRGIDGYAPSLTLAEAQRLGMIVATHLDGQPLAIGGLGPLWAVVDADRVPDLAAKPLAERFALCPWGLYQIGVNEPG
ncbi:molybdopterin-dependent oxidoreductase [Ottowia sp. GY511]|uniref:Molybdopterin-dependent oxidoreductase n=1 Tax=Ottowia flava TaxID=2675430 RepID=A0ABW4KM15_9BURK|nr:molybdopterin-dependent oxidoreductase [Ottowia sp. GY511]TXK24862.1 molybdopterin-dependent oxidoreductase [Ottowia sp. GY511]